MQLTMNRAGLAQVLSYPIFLLVLKFHLTPSEGWKAESTCGVQTTAGPSHISYYGAIAQAKDCHPSMY